jgi:hypothetical protein
VCPSFAGSARIAEFCHVEKLNTFCLDGLTIATLADVDKSKVVYFTHNIVCLRSDVLVSHIVEIELPQLDGAQNSEKLVEKFFHAAKCCSVDKVFEIYYLDRSGVGVLLEQSSICLANLWDVVSTMSIKCFQLSGSCGNSLSHTISTL